MPISPVSYQPRPYVRGGRLSELLLAQGQQQAESERHRGDISARMWSELGQNISGGIQNYAQQRADAPRIAQETEARDLQLSTAKREAATSEQEARAEQNLRGLFQRGDPDPQEIIATVGPERGSRIVAGLTTLRTAKQEDFQNQRQIVAKVALGIKALPEGLRPDGWQTSIQSLAERGLIGPEEAKAPYSPEALDQAIQWALTPQQVWDKAHPALIQRDPSRDLVHPETGAVVTPGTPDAPTDFEWVNRGGRPVQIPKGTAQTGDRPYQPPSQAQPAADPLEAVIGPDGNPVLVPRSQARGMRPATTREQPTEDERKTAGFYGQMKDAIAILDTLEGSLTEKELYQIQTMPQEGLVGMANRGELGENAKRYLRAFEQFTESRLRPVSGAAINDSEYARDRRTYAKQYGETPNISTDRQAARDRALDSLRTRASRALPKDETTAPNDGATKPIDGFPGTEQTFRNGKWIRTK